MTSSPNLVEVVKAYAKHEKETLTAVTEARAKVGAMQVPKISLMIPKPSTISGGPGRHEQCPFATDGRCRALS